MKSNRSILVFAFAIFSITGTALAQTFPQRPVTLVAPYQPGGPVDIVARVVARGLSTEWGGSVVIDNRAGAGGNIGTEFVIRAPADGHTLLLNTGALLISPLVSPKLTFDPMRDLAPITKIGFAPALLIVNAKSPFKTVADLVAYGRANPGKLNFGSPGNATTLHLCSELFRSLAGFEATHIPFRGSAPSIAAIMGDQIQFHYDAIMASLPHVKAGSMRTLAVSSTTRSPQAPDIPTMVEAGVPGYDASIWFGVFAPIATPALTVERLTRDFQRALQQPDVKKQLENSGFIIVGNAPREFAQQMAAEAKTWAEVVKKTGVKAE